MDLFKAPNHPNVERKRRIRLGGKEGQTVWPSPWFNPGEGRSGENEGYCGKGKKHIFINLRDDCRKKTVGQNPGKQMLIKCPKKWKVDAPPPEHVDI